MVKWFACLAFIGCTSAVASAESATFEVGVAAREITPALPVETGSRRKNKVTAPLYAKAVAFQDRAGAKVVLVSVDTMEMPDEFARPWANALSEQLGIEPAHLILVATHTHSAPNINTIWGGTVAPGYLDFLRQKLTEAVRAALNDLKPAQLDYGIGRATFAINRRSFAGGEAKMLPNPDGPVDWDVPVLRVRSADGSVRAVLFGYACHAVADLTFTGEPEGLSPDYPGYAGEELERAYPGSVAIYLTGFGGDQNPYPMKGEVLTAADAPWPHAGGDHEVDRPYARPHGLELAGAVAGVMDRPMQVVEGSMKMAYREVNLALTPPPARQQIEADARDPSALVSRKKTSEKYLSMLKRHEPLPQSVSLPISALRLGNLTLLFMAGEPVVDYASRFKRLLAPDPILPIGYAYQTGFYIPTARLLKEGGYEPDCCLAENGYYGRFDPSIERTITDAMVGLVASFHETKK